MSDHALIARPTWFCKSCWREKIMMMNLQANSSRDARVRVAGSLPALACVSLTYHVYLPLCICISLSLSLSFSSCLDSALIRMIDSDPPGVPFFRRVNIILFHPGTNGVSHFVPMHYEASYLIKHRKNDGMNTMGP